MFYLIMVANLILFKIVFQIILFINKEFYNEKQIK